MKLAGEMNIFWRVAKDLGMGQLHAVKIGKDGLSDEAVCGFRPYTGWWPAHHRRSVCMSCEKMIGKEKKEA